ncbi:MAG: hypothetical protein WC428_06270 [Candidatus Paceibacterota bacterium]
MMKLILESCVKNPDGIIDISVFIQNIKQDVPKRYTYHLASEYQARRFNTFYRKGKKLHGKALQILKQWNISEVM